MTKACPLVSVVLPTYNQAEYLCQALDSILDQTLRDYELIVVNDGSTDETPRILYEYQKRHGIIVIHQENQRLPLALNSGFRMARGYYLTWTSSDNIMKSHMLEVLVDALERRADLGLVYADWEVIDKSGRVINSVRTLDYDRNLLMRTNYINACFLYRRACQQMIGLYDPDYIHAEDWEYWWRISQHFEMMRIPQVLYQYRVHNSSLSERKVIIKSKGLTVGYKRLVADFRTKPLAWYVSKLKWEWLRLKHGWNLEAYLNPQVDDLQS